MDRIYRNNIAELGTPSLTAGVKQIAVTGSLRWFKDGEWGYAYKKHSATSWTYVSTAGQDIDATIGSLEDATKYDVCLYVKFDNAYQRGAVASATTEE